MTTLGKLLAIASIAGFAFGCDPGSRRPDRASTMTILSEERDAQEIRSGNPKYMLFLPLVDRHGPDIRPRLAESWEHSPDYRTWTFHIRDDVVWHDGVPVTAHDVAFSLELFAHPDVLFYGRISAVDSISVPDDHTITLFLSQEYYVDPRKAFTVFFPKHLLEDLDPAEFYEWDFWTRPVGNGPYRFVRYTPQTAFELEANPGFYAGKPAIERAVIRLGSNNPMVALTSGGADVVFSLRPAEVLALRDDPRFVVYHYEEWTEVYLIYWNHSHPLLGDGTVRRALTHAIDRRELVQVLAFPDDVSLVGGLGNEELADPGRRRGWDRVPAYDPAMAARLLDRAGWSDGDGDGVREKAGRQARFTLLAPSSGALGGVAQAVLIQQQLQRMGVSVEIHPLESAGLVRKAIESGDFDAAITWVDQDPHTILYNWFGGPADTHPDSDPESRSGPFGYYDAEAAHLFEILLDEPDPRAQDTLYLRVKEILRRDMPVTLLFPGVYNHAAHRRIRGFRQGWPSALSYAEQLLIREGP
jgi:peptide/nickel transport system substrate-binding protein